MKITLEILEKSKFSYIKCQNNWKNDIFSTYFREISRRLLEFWKKLIFLKKINLWLADIFLFIENFNFDKNFQTNIT